MGVKPVDGYGNITSGNAKEIYLAWKHGEIDLEVSQQKFCESFFSPEDWDEIDYDVETNHKDGYNQISDAEKADSHGGQAGNVAVTAAPAAILTTLAICPILDGFNQWFCALAANLGGVAGLLAATLFDAGYNDRKSAEENSSDTNGIIDSQNEMLQGSMDMMNEDMANYDAKSQEYMVTVNSTNAELADLQVQLADAEASGDTQGAAAIRAQIKALQEQGFEGDEEELQGMRDGLEEYRAMGDESLGVADAGTSVSEFLKEGTVLAIPAALNTAFYTVCGALSGAAALGSVPKLAPFFPDAISSAIAKALLGVAAGLFGTAAAIFGTKTKQEFECGSAGNDMEDHVNSLNDMIGEQTGYIEDTEGFYGEADETRAEDNSQGETMANDNSTGNGGLMIHVDPSAKNNPFAPTNSGTKAQDKS